MADGGIEMKWDCGEFSMLLGSFCSELTRFKHFCGEFIRFNHVLW